MKRIVLFLLGALLLTVQAEEIDSPLVHAEEYPHVVTFQTDQTGVFAVVALSSSEELSTPDPSFTLNPSEDPEPEETEELTASSVTPASSFTPAPSEGQEIVEEKTEEPMAFIISTRSTRRSLVYTLTLILPEGREIEGGPD